VLLSTLQAGITAMRLDVSQEPETARFVGWLSEQVVQEFDVDPSLAWHYALLSTSMAGMDAVSRAGQKRDRDREARCLRFLTAGLEGAMRDADARRLRTSLGGCAGWLAGALEAGSARRLTRRNGDRPVTASWRISAAASAVRPRSYRSASPRRTATGQVENVEPTGPRLRIELVELRRERLRRDGVAPFDGQPRFSTSWRESGSRSRAARITGRSRSRTRTRGGAEDSDPDVERVRRIDRVHQAGHPGELQLRGLRAQRLHVREVHEQGAQPDSRSGGDHPRGRER
jgi:hypothetical protein